MARKKKSSKKKTVETLTHEEATRTNVSSASTRATKALEVGT